MDKIKQYEIELEDNPITQIQFHKRMMRVWAINVPIITSLYIGTFLFPDHAIQVLSFISFYTAMVSLYANWVSDFDGLSAAQSTLETMKQNQAQEYPPQITETPLTLKDLLKGSNKPE